MLSRWMFPDLPLRLVCMCYGGVYAPRSAIAEYGAHMRRQELRSAMMLVSCHECGVGEGRVVGGRCGCFPWWEVGDGVGCEDGLDLALPDGEGCVTEGAEGGEVAGVSLFVGGEFGLPEFAVDGEVRVVYIHRFCRGRWYQCGCIYTMIGGKLELG